MEPVILFSVIGLVVGWIVRTVSVNRRLAAAAQRQADLQTKLIEKFGTAAEVQGFLESEGGRRFLRSTAVETSRPAERILNAVQLGTLIVLASAGVLAARGIPNENAHGALTFIGTVGLMVGAGFLASAAMVFVTSRFLGLEVGVPKAMASESADR
jgi:hypothetical protein